MELKIGSNYFVRTDTDHWIGRLLSIDGPYTVTLTDAAWIAESGRLHLFLQNGRADGMEIEPIRGKGRRALPIMIHGCKAVIEWDHPLFTEAV